MGYLGFTPRHIGVTYPRISLTETPMGSIDSIALECDGPVCAIPSPCTLVEVWVFLFCAGVELGFSSYRFLLGMGEEPIGMLMIFSLMTVGRMGDSYSLEISIASGSLNIPHSPTLIMYPINLHLYSATHTQYSTTVLGSTLN